MRFVRYVLAYWRAPVRPSQYERGQMDALHAIRDSLEAIDPCHDRVREEVDERLRRIEEATARAAPGGSSAARR